MTDIERARAKREESQHEWLLVAKDSTLAACCCYLRDIGVQILDHRQRRDGRWVVKVMKERTQ